MKNKWESNGKRFSQSGSLFFVFKQGKLFRAFAKSWPAAVWRDGKYGTKPIRKEMVENTLSCLRFRNFNRCLPSPLATRSRPHSLVFRELSRDCGRELPEASASGEKGVFRGHHEEG